jgi:RNA polymerase sigma-70 factor (ECF subfamily)
MVTSRRDAGSEPDRAAILIGRSKNGDRKAFDQLVTIHQDHLRRFVRRKISNQEDAADLCQEVLLRAYLKLDSFQGRSRFRTWLLSIAKRAVAEYYRSNRGATIIAQNQAAKGSDFRTERSRSCDSMEEICDMRRQIDHCLACIMKSLSLKEQVAVILCDIYGFTDKESSMIVRNKSGAFKHQLHRARAMMDHVGHKHCPLVRKTGDFCHCDSCDPVGHSLPGTFGTLRNKISRAEPRRSALLFLRAELFWEIESLIHPYLARPSARWPLHLSAKLISKACQHKQPSPETRCL